MVVTFSALWTVGQLDFSQVPEMLPNRHAQSTDRKNTDKNPGSYLLIPAITLVWRRRTLSGKQLRRTRHWDSAKRRHYPPASGELLRMKAVTSRLFRAAAVEPTTFVVNA